LSASGELELEGEGEKEESRKGVYMMRDEEKEGRGFSFGGRAVGFTKRPKHAVTRCSATVREGLFIGIGDEWSMQGQRG
jgi:hypothetical protein